MTVDRFQSCIEIATAVRSRACTAVDVVQAHLRRIDSLDSELNSFVQVFHEDAICQAKSVDTALDSGESVGPLVGVPIAIKDNIATRLGRTTCGSRMLSEYRSPFNATAVQQVLDAGAVIIGKTNLDEFAMGSSTEHGIAGPCRNPWDSTRVAGGSSGGSAVAVETGMCALALGSDTGGSVRQPAGWTGVVGLKPTYGRVSRHGLVAFGSSLDQIGPIARNVQDAALATQVISGFDPRDSTSVDRSLPDLVESLKEPLENVRVGLPRQYISDENHADITTAVDRTCELLRDHGATIVDIDLPMTRYGVATYYVIAPAEASSNLARLDGVRYGRRAELSDGASLTDFYSRSRTEGFGEEVRRRIMLGTYVLSAGYHDQYYTCALKVRRLIQEEFERAFTTCDVLLGPTSPLPAFTIGAMTNPVDVYNCDVYTVNTNIAGICGVSVPCGMATIDGTRLPVGLHLQAPAFDEKRLLKVASLCERLSEPLPLPPVCGTMDP